MKYIWKMGFRDLIYIDVIVWMNHKRWHRNDILIFNQQAFYIYKISYITCLDLLKMEYELMPFPF